MNEMSDKSLGEAHVQDGRTRFLVIVTSYVTLLPYVGLAAWIWTHNLAQVPSRVLAVYAALMFAYTGAVQWGWAIATHPTARVYFWSILALVIAWILASLPWYSISLPLLAIATAGFWYAERRWFADYVPGWYRAVRAQTALLAALALAAAWIAVLVHKF